MILQVDYYYYYMFTHAVSAYAHTPWQKHGHMTACTYVAQTSENISTILLSTKNISGSIFSCGNKFALMTARLQLGEKS